MKKIIINFCFFILFLLPSLFLIYFSKNLFFSINDYILFTINNIYILFGIIFLFNNNKFITFLLFSTLIFLPFELFYSYYYKYYISTEILTLLLNTNIQEFFEMIKFYGLIIILYIYLLIKIWKYYIKHQYNFFINKYLRIFYVLIVGILLLFSNNNFSLEKTFSNIKIHKIYKKSFKYFPISEYVKIYTIIDIVKIQFKIQKMKKNENTKYEYNSQNIKKVFLIIGESGRKFSYNYRGYHRDTNKYTKKQNWLFFDNVMSLNTYTASSLKTLLENKITNDFEILPDNILDIYNKRSFNTYWISNRGKFGLLTDNIRLFSNNRKYNKFFFNEYNFNAHSFDEVLVEEINKNIIKNKNNFYIVHFMGSHFKYSDRYPKEFQVFGDSTDEGFFYDESKDKLNNKRNNYDNSILYTDYVLSQIVDNVSKNIKNEEILILYISDHGENLRETDEKLIGHGTTMPTKYEVEVPLMIWRNDLYKKNNPKKWKKLEKSLNKKISNNNILETLIELSDIKSYNYIKKRSIINKDFVEEDRIINSINGLKFHEREL